MEKKTKKALAAKREAEENYNDICAKNAELVLELASLRNRGFWARVFNW